MPKLNVINATGEKLFLTDFDDTRQIEMRLKGYYYEHNSNIVKHNLKDILEVLNLYLINSNNEIIPYE